MAFRNESSEGKMNQRGSWASTDGVRRSMLANRRSDTKPELALRRELHCRGLRFRKDHRIELADRSVRADIVFTRCRVAVFVDGCFWHRCPIHATDPKANADYWIPKLERNAARDKAITKALLNEGWTVVRIWEHEGVESAADRVCEAVTSATQCQQPSGQRGSATAPAHARHSSLPPPRRPASNAGTGSSSPGPRGRRSRGS